MLRARKELHLTVNGREYNLEVVPQLSLLELLREELELTGTKEGCSTGECGACTVIMDGEVVRSCLILALEAQGSEIITIEGLLGPEGELDPVQKALVDNDAVQCGFCTPGFVMALRSLFDNNKSPNEKEVKEALGGHLCRCTGYKAIYDAVEDLKEYYKG